MKIAGTLGGIFKFQGATRETKYMGGNDLKLLQQ